MVPLYWYFLFIDNALHQLMSFKNIYTQTFFFTFFTLCSQTLFYFVDILCDRPKKSRPWHPVEGTHFYSDPFTFTRTFTEKSAWWRQILNILGYEQKAMFEEKLTHRHPWTTQNTATKTRWWQHYIYTYHTYYTLNILRPQKPKHTGRATIGQCRSKYVHVKTFSSKSHKEFVASF